MSIIHVQQIMAFLVKQYADVVDVSDYDGRPQVEADNAFLSRSLAAFAISHFADIEPEQAALAVTDGGQDNGIDALYFDSTEMNLYVVQSKWRKDGGGSVILGLRLVFRSRQLGDL